MSLVLLSATVCLILGSQAQINSIKDGTNSCSAEQVACMATDDNVILFPASSGRGDQQLYIGGIFSVRDRESSPYSCGLIDTDSFQEIMAFQWSVATSRRRLGTKAPSGAMGSVVFDTCGTDYTATQSVFGLENCKTKPYVEEALGIDSPSYVSSQATHVDRSSIIGYISAVDARNGQIQDEGVQITTGLNKPLINTGTYSDNFSGAKQFFITPTVKQQMDATATVIAESVSSKESFVMVVYSDDRFSIDAFTEFKLRSTTKNICIVYESKLDAIPNGAQLDRTAEEVLLNKNARFVVSLISEPTFEQLYRRILSRTNNVYNLTFVFPPFAEKAGSVVSDSGVSALGSIQVRHGKSSRWTTEFENFYRQLRPEQFPSVPLVSEFWQERFRCNIRGLNRNIALRYRSFCDNSAQTLQDDKISSRVAYIITAVDALLVTIGDVARMECNGSQFCPEITREKFRQAIRKFADGGEIVFQNETGGPASWRFDVYNLQRAGTSDRYMKVGAFRDNNFEFDESKSIRAYQRNATNVDEPYPVDPVSVCPPGDCLKCRDPIPPSTTLPAPKSTTSDDTGRILQGYSILPTHKVSKNAYLTGIHFRQRRHDSEFTTRLYASESRSVWSVALAVLAGLGIIAVIIVEITLIYLIKTYKFEEPDGQKRSHLNFRTLWLGQLLLFGIFLSYLTLFAYLPVPTNATCGITRFGVGISYAIMFSCLLVKIMIIHHSRSTQFIPGEATSFYRTVTYMVTLFLIAFSVQLIIDMHWLIQIPPQAVLVKDNGGELAWICNHFTWSLEHGFWEMQFYLRTEFENHLLSLIYIMFLMAVIFFYSIAALDVVVNMRESRFISLASGISILICFAWAMIGGLLKNHEKAHEIGDGCIGFGLFFTATVILFSMFLPKVRQLVTIGLEGVFLEDDKETTYASSIYSPGSIVAPAAHRSMSGYADGSVIGMHTVPTGMNYSADDLYGRPVINMDTSFMSTDPPFKYNPHALRLLHPRSSGPSLYSVRSTPNLYDPSELYGAGIRQTRTYTNRSFINDTLPGSEYPSLYRPKSEVLLYNHPRSDIGSL